MGVMTMQGRALKRSSYAVDLRTLNKKKKKDKNKKPHIFQSLPPELIVDIVAHLVSDSPTPLSDLETLRTTCKSFYKASTDKVVGRCMAVKNEWYLYTWNKERYVTFLGLCSDLGNSQANYVIGMIEVYSLGRTASGLHHLKRAMTDGHDVATYIMGIFLFRNSATRPLGIELLNGLAIKDTSATGTSTPDEYGTKSGGGILIDSCRRETVLMLRKVKNRITHLIQRKACHDKNCGRAARREDDDRWWEEGVQCIFCSQLCRWNREYNTFVKQIRM